MKKYEKCVLKTIARIHDCTGHGVHNNIGQIYNTVSHNLQLLFCSLDNT